MTGADLEPLRRFYDVAARISAGGRLPETLRAVADGVVQGLGFGAAAVNLRQTDGTFVVVAVAGPQSAVQALSGTVEPAGAFQAEFASADRWGQLRFVPHERTGPGLHGWAPDVPDPPEPQGLLAAPDPGVWHRLDALYAPLMSGDELVGILSVDLPPGGRRPDAGLRQLLELFAVQASIAIVNARLAEQLQAERAELAAEHARLQAGELAFRLAFEGAGNAMAIVGLEPGSLGVFLRVNDALCELFGYTREQLLTRRVADIVDASQAGAVRDALDAAAAGRLPAYQTDRQYRRPDGSGLWLRISTAVIDAGPGRAPFLLVHGWDVTTDRQVQAQLQHTADHDPLTGLVNRAVLERRVAAARSHGQRSQRESAVLYCDLDGFKQINDQYGHATGDRVLRHVASQLQAAVRQRDTVARLGGDEFVVLVEDTSDPDLVVLLDRIRRAVAAPLPELDARVTLSIGWVTLDAADDTAALLHAADQAMYNDKMRQATRRRPDRPGDPGT